MSRKTEDDFPRIGVRKKNLFSLGELGFDPE